VHVGHSTGGGEVVHYLAAPRRKPVAKAAIHQRGAAAMGKDDAIRAGCPKDVFDGPSAQLAASRSPVLLTICPLDRLMVITAWCERSGHDLELVAPGHDGSAKGAYDGIVAFSQTDFTEDPEENHVRSW